MDTKLILHFHGSQLSNSKKEENLFLKAGVTHKLANSIYGTLQMENEQRNIFSH